MIFFRIIWPFSMCRLVLWWPEVSRCPSMWVELAGKMICQDLLNAVFPTDMKIGIISAPIDQSWWFFRLIWSFPLYQLPLWWLEVSTWPSRWLELAGKMFCHQTLYTAYTMRVWRQEGVQNINFLAIFRYFPNPHINWDQKSLVEQGKVKKLQNGSPQRNLFPW